jgi:hypothetical protein
MDIYMFNDLLYIYSTILGERWKGIEILKCGQKILQYQKKEEPQKKIEHISVSAITFSGNTHSQKISNQRIKTLGSRISRCQVREVKPG